MKKHVSLILLCLSLALGLTLLLSSCAGRALATPARVAVDQITLTLSWKPVGGAAYYTVEINDGKEKVQKDSGKNEYSLERLAEGTYTIRVRAVAKDSEEGRSDSAWSEPLTFVREKETGLAFTLSTDGRSFLVSGVGSAEGEITVPTTYRGLPVTGIADRAFYNSGAVTYVHLGEGITSIGKQAFANCSYLTGVDLPDTLTGIGVSAFQSCRAFTKPLRIPDSVTTIGKQAFEYCRKLPAVTFGSKTASIGEAAFGGCEALTSVTLPDSLTELGESAFVDCLSLSSVTIGNGLGAVPANAFNGCTALASVSLGSGVTEIGDGAFGACTSLGSIRVGEALTGIGENAFSGCTSLSEVTGIGASLTRIGKNAFASTALFDGAKENAVYVGGWFLGVKNGDMRGMTIADGTVGIAEYALSGCEYFDDRLTLPDSLLYIGTGAFSNCKKLNAVIIGKRVREIGDDAFLGCVALTNVILGSYDRSQSSGLGESSLETIGRYAFYSCSSLKLVTMPDCVRSIGQYAFRKSGIYENAKRDVYAGNWLVDCKSDGAYGTVAVAEGTVGIADYAFYNCVGVTGVILPETVRVIGRGAFYKCRLLSSVNLPAGITEIKDYTFYHCDSLVLPEFPEGLTRIGRSAFYKCRLVSEDGESEENRLVIPDSVREIGAFAFYGCVYTYTDRATALQMTGGMDYLVIGSGVSLIGEQAFSGMTTLRGVALGSSVTGIGDKAFYKCTSLAAVDFDPALVSIGEKAFYQCSALEKIRLPASLETIGRYAFYKCTSVKVLELGGAREIGDAAFLGCTGLTELNLPETLTVIGKQAFRGCTGLSGVVLGTGITSVGAHAFYGCPNLTVFLAGEEIPAGFDERWNSSYRPVVLGTAVGEDGTVSFVIGAGNPKNLNQSNVLTAPGKEGMTFAGWSTVPDASSAEYTPGNVKNAPDGTRLYAVYRRN